MKSFSEFIIQVLAGLAAPAIIAAVLYLVSSAGPAIRADAEIVKIRHGQSLRIVDQILNNNPNAEAAKNFFSSDSIRYRPEFYFFKLNIVNSGKNLASNVSISIADPAFVAILKKTFPSENFVFLSKDQFSKYNIGSIDPNDSIEIYFVVASYFSFEGLDKTVRLFENGSKVSINYFDERSDFLDLTKYIKNYYFALLFLLLFGILFIALVSYVLIIKVIVKLHPRSILNFYTESTIDDFRKTLSLYDEQKELLARNRLGSNQSPQE
jgi:hypothetical protein